MRSSAWPGDDERRARLVDQDGIDLVDDGVVQAALEALLDVHRHVVAQIVETELVIGAVGDIGGVGGALLLGLHVRQVDAHRHAEELEDLPHPFGVAIGEVVVDRDDVHALAGQRVEVRGQRRHQRLALAGLHLGDLAVMQHHAAQHLHVEVAHAQRALGGLAHHRERLGQQLVDARAVGVPLLQLVGFLPQRRVGQLLERGLERVDLRHGVRVLLEQPLVAAAEDVRGEVTRSIRTCEGFHGYGKAADFTGTWRARPARRGGGDEELARVLRRAPEAHLEMQVRAGGAAGGADFADLLATLHQIALAHHDLRGMGVARHEVVAVIDVDHVAVLGMKAGENDYAAGGSDDRRAVVGDEVDAFVHRPLAVERIDAPAEARGVVGRAHRHHGRDHLLLHRLLEQLRLQHAEHVVAALDLAREHQQLLAELAERQVLRRQQRRRAAAQTRRLGGAEFLRLDAGEGRQALAERVHAGEVRLHLAQLHRHRIQVLLEEHALTLGLRLLRGGDSRCSAGSFTSAA